MRLRTLTLRDFGTIRGEQTLDLAPREKHGRQRPIVLIGGQNGAGKTTILEAVRLCLYGRLALGNRVTDADYKKFLRDRIHRDRNALIHSDAALIRLSFDYARAGRRTVYTVERSWRAQGKASVAEDVTVLRDGQPLPDVESQHWESFVRSLVPYGLSQLFFFDGEKIQKLAEEGGETDSLAESVKTMLGLDLVEQLQADLGLFELKHLSKSTTRKDTQTRLAELDTELASLQETDARLCQECGDLVSKLDAVGGELARAEERLSQRGKGLADERKRLTQGEREFQARIEENEKTLMELLEGPLPLALCSRLGKATLVQIDNESRQARARISKGEIEAALKAVEHDLTKPAFLKLIGLAPDGKRVLADQLARTRAKVLEPHGQVDSPVLHGLSEHDARRCRNQIQQGTQGALQQAQKLAQELERHETKLRQVRSHLRKAPERDDLAPLVAQLETLGERRGALKAALEQRQKEREGVQNSLARNRRDRDRLSEEAKQEGASNEKLERCIQLKTMLPRYLERLTQEKVQELEQRATESFARLCRKGDLVRHIKIDPVTFRVSLHDAHGRVLQKEELSAGEKQIYAISILWALAKVAGRPLPMIIDTPLGRLDSQHRRRLVEDYFPQVSHQVIILSTDTEIGHEYVDALRPYTSHSYHLVYNEEEGWTKASSGYFWSGDAASTATV